MVWSLHIDLGVFIDVEGSTKARCFPACGNAVVYLSRTQEPFFFFFNRPKFGNMFKNSLVTHIIKVRRERKQRLQHFR